MSKKLLLLIGLIVSGLSLLPQKPGTPIIRNYEVSDLPAGAQTWMIDESPDGIVFFANNEGVLCFDGLNWTVYPLPGGIVVRSVYAPVDSIVYAGGFNQLGYLKKDQLSGYVFHSLLDLLPSDKQDFGEIWKIYPYRDGIVFQSYEQLMWLQENRFEVIPAPSSFHFSFLLNGELFINDRKLGLHRLVENRLTLLPGVGKLKGKEIWAMLPFGDEVLLATDRMGLFRFNGVGLREWVSPAASLLKESQIYTACQIGDAQFAFGTVQNGVLLTDTSGNQFQLINFDRGLQNNTILSMYPDRFGNLWLGLDAGIDYLEINSPLSYFSYPDQISAGYASALFKGILYLGTNRGVFYKAWVDLLSGNSEPFIRIPETEGQVWSLQVIDNQLFCGHNSGVFQIVGNRAKKISDEPGGWAFVPLPGNKNTILCGTYQGLLRLEKRNGNWFDEGKLPGFKESSRVMALDKKQRLWISHGYKGIFQLTFDSAFQEIRNVNLYGKSKGLPNDFNLQLAPIQNEIVIATGEGLFRFEEENNRFIRYESFERKFPLPEIRVLKEDEDGNVWYFTAHQMGVFRLQEDGNYVNVSMPFRELTDEFIKGFEHVNLLDDAFVIIGVQKGFVHYNPNYLKNYQQDFSAFIHEVRLGVEDSLLFRGNERVFEHDQPVSSHLNHWQFRYAANYNENPEETSFSCFLEGFDSQWSAFQSSASKEYTNLPSGKYVFRVKAKNVFDHTSQEAMYQFEILPPWYLSYYGYFLYFVMFVFGVYGLSLLIRKRVEISKKQEEARQRQLYEERERQLKAEALEAEKEVIRLRNENLRDAMRQKDKELANSTMQMIQKSKTLTRIKNDIEKFAKEINDELLRSQLASMIRKIDREINSEQQWEVFEKHFENVYEEFLGRLKAAFPDLTPREMKLCAYLRLNISSKEIAALMNISTRGVEISRYRLRKKLRLEHDVNLTEFIMSF